jgi:hypothetical protein
LEDIYNISPYPFDSGESWVYGVEFGMSNFNNFMAKKVASSRSGGGIQIQGDLGGESVKKKYMSVLLEEFDEMLKRRDIVIRSGI